MSKNNDDLKMTKEALEKEHGRAISDHEAAKAKEFIDLIARMVVDITFRETAREQKLLEHPNGYHLEGSHTCPICNKVCKDESSWYDKYGVKCITCQDAINKKIIPPTLCAQPESYYSMFDLEHFFNLNGKILRSWIRGGILKARVIPGLDRGTHATLFLIKDNKKFLPPKRLLKSGIIKEEKDGKEEYVFPIPWYRLCDNPLAKIKKYGIVEHLVALKK